MTDDDTTDTPTVIVLPTFDQYAMDPERLLTADEWNAWSDHLEATMLDRLELKFPATRFVLVPESNVEQAARMFRASTQRDLDHDTAATIDEIMGDVALSDWPIRD